MTLAKEQLTAHDFVDELIAGWACWETNRDNYLQLVREVVNGGSPKGLKDNERIILEIIRAELTHEEWTRLPEIILQRLPGRLAYITSPRRREVHKHLQRVKEAQVRQEQLAQLRQLEEENRRKLTEEAEQRRSRERLLEALADVFETNFLAADDVYQHHPYRHLLSEQEYEDLKAQFVLKWFQRNFSPDQLSLSLEQARAVASVSRHTLAVARAGSGKTRTLVARAVFLLRHCGVRPTEMALLVFNRKAQEEMQRRLAELLGDRKSLPHILTFHALAFAIVNPEEQLLMDDPGQPGIKSREIQAVIDQHLVDPNYREQIRDCMLRYFRTDWERIVRAGFHLDKEGFLAYRRSLPQETLQGEIVKSYGEKLIANTLFEHGIPYLYEKAFRWNGTVYRPDFTIMDGDRRVIIEYFGLLSDPEYDTMAKEKRRFWSQQKRYHFIELTSDDLKRLGEKGFVELLLDHLRAAGLTPVKLNDDEIWKRARKRAIDRFTMAVHTFIARCRKLGLQPEDLTQKIHNYQVAEESEKKFWVVAQSVYKAYLERLREKRQQDFDGLVWEAATKIRSGKTNFTRNRGREHGDVAQWRFLLIDEFQDFSKMFFELVQAIRTQAPQVNVFCVGDDWQAINRFAGADTVYFTRFHEFFPGGRRVPITTNYRSAQLIVEAGNALMARQGPPAKSHRKDQGRIFIADLDRFVPTSDEESRHRADVLTPAVLRLLKWQLHKARSILLLSRTNTPPGVSLAQVQHNWMAKADSPLDVWESTLRRRLPEEYRRLITVDTVHGSKGLEASVVIVIDALNSRYPLVHPHWVFSRILGEHSSQIEEDERRLFYVALTRAKDTLILVTEGQRESPFIKEIARWVQPTRLRWDTLPPASGLEQFKIQSRGEQRRSCAQAVAGSRISLL